MDYNVNTHGDLIVNIGSHRYNFGYNALLTIPSFIWLARWQQNHSNLFRDTRYLTEEREALSRESQETLQNVLSFSRTLPLDLDTFNRESRMQNFSSFTSGNHSLFYSASLQSDGDILYSSQAKGTSKHMPIFTLEFKDFLSFTQGYVSFIQESEEFGKYQWEVPAFASKLGKHNF